MYFWLPKGNCILPRFSTCCLVMGIANDFLEGEGHFTSHLEGVNEQLTSHIGREGLVLHSVDTGGA